MGLSRSRRAGTSGARTRGRASPSPRASFEELEIRTADGVALRAVVEDPPPDIPMRGTCVMAHAMFARKSEFGRRDRAGLAQAYAARGWRVVAFDFRGHGDSATDDRSWGYDDLVRFDLPAVVDCARARSEGQPVVVLGHSLGGHVALAAQGAGRMGADGVIAVAANVWLRELEGSQLRWAAKRVLGRGLREAMTRIGHVPARRLRVGSDDASGRVIGDFLRFMDEGAWRSADGADDYLDALGRMLAPVCVVSSAGDRVICHPASAEALARRCGGPVEALRIVYSDDGSRPPGHMAIITTPRARATLLRALRWMEAIVESPAGTLHGI